MTLFIPLRRSFAGCMNGTPQLTAPETNDVICGQTRVRLHLLDVRLCLSSAEISRVERNGDAWCRLDQSECRFIELAQHLEIGNRNVEFAIADGLAFKVVTKDKHIWCAAKHQSVCDCGKRRMNDAAL